MNELPMRKVFIQIDGPTGGPNVYIGDIGVKLMECQSKPVANFPTISIDNCFLDNLRAYKDPGSDQEYLRDIILAISSGSASESLANRSPGKLGYARWLTTGNRILRTYISYENPSPDLVKMCNFIINVYACNWFAIKAKPYFYDSPRHIYNMIINTRKLNDSNITEKVNQVISQNSYSLHSENMLCAMMTDDRPNVRMMAINKIIKCRESIESTVRQFIKPTIDFSADDYYKLIDPDSVWLESILTKHLSIDYLRCHIDKFSFEKYPSHTQAVERNIQLVSRTSTSLVDNIERDARIHITLMERYLMPYFKSKKDFNKL